MTAPEPWLPANEIAEHLATSKDTAYSWIADRALPILSVGRISRFQVSEVDDWVGRGGAETADSN